MNILLYFMLLAFCVELSINEVHKAITFDRFESCVHPSTSPMDIRDILITTINHTTYISSTTEFTRDIKRIKIVIKVTRCANREMLDSCAYFTTLRMEDMCPLVEKNGTVISPLIYASKPPAICPYRKGQYKLINGNYDPNMVQFFPLDKWYWKFEMNFYDTDTNEYLIRMCVDGQVVIFYS